MTRDEFVCMLITKYYQAKEGEKIQFDDGTIITEQMLGKILDALSLRS